MGEPRNWFEHMGGFTIRAKKFISNPLLARKQCVLEVIHPNAGNVSKKDLREKLATAYKIPDVNCVHVFGMKTAFGGGRSTGFALMYDNLAAAKVRAEAPPQARWHRPAYEDRPPQSQGPSAPAGEAPRQGQGQGRLFGVSAPWTFSRPGFPDLP